MPVSVVSTNPIDYHLARGNRALLTVHERLTRGRAPGHVDIDRHDPVATPHDAVRVVVVPAAVRAASHANNPPRLGHLIVHLAQGRRHLVRQGAGDNHHVRLTGRRAENDTQAILIVPRGGEVHHFHGAARETEGHGPEGALAGPVRDDIERGPGECV